jgi:uncharacterized protein (DUF2249 family)
MNDVLIASNSADAAAVETVRSHHAELAGALTAKVSALSAAVRNGRDATTARDDLAAWCATDLLPHARAEEKALYPAALAIPRSRMLVEAMIAEHQVLTDLANRVARATDAVEAVGAAIALKAVFDSHLEKENEQVLPVLAEASDVALADLLKGMHEALEADEAAAPTTGHGHGHGHGHSCTCGEQDAAGDPELDTRLIPHAIRHATIFGALDALRPGGGIVISASHDPLPLLAQIEQRTPGAFAIEYLERGPETWRLRFARQA